MTGHVPGRDDDGGRDVPSVSSLDRALEEAGIIPGDPLYPLIRCLQEIVGRVERGSAALQDSVQHAGDAQVARIEKRAAELEVSGAERLSRAIERAALLDRRRGVFRLAVVVGCCVVGAGVIGAGFGYAVGRATVGQVEGEVAAAFRDGPGAAADWARLMRLNDPRAALARCAGPLVREVEGRTACFVPLWISEGSTP